MSEFIQQFIPYLSKDICWDIDLKAIKGFTDKEVDIYTQEFFISYCTFCATACVTHYFVSNYQQSIKLNGSTIFSDKIKWVYFVNISLSIDREILKY